MMSASGRLHDISASSDVGYTAPSKTGARPMTSAWRFVVLGLAAAALSTGARAQGTDYSKIEITTEKIAPNLYLLSGSAGPAPPQPEPARRPNGGLPRPDRRPRADTPTPPPTTHGPAPFPSQSPSAAPTP